MKKVSAVVLTLLAVLLADWIGLLAAVVAWAIAGIQQERRAHRSQSGLRSV